MSNNLYEFTYIINPVLDEDKFAAVVDKVNELIKKHGGEVDEVDLWGLRPLAYEIDKKNNAYYVNMYFNAPNEAIAKIERALRIDDDVLRFLTLKYDAKMLRHRELKKNNAVPSIFDVEEDENEDNKDED